MVVPEPPQLHEGEVHIWDADLNCSNSLISELFQLLSTDEQARAKQYRLNRDYKHYIVARAILRKILSRYLITEPAQISFSYNQYGKPFLKEDKSEQQLMFNLSHSNGIALYAITLGKDIGVDIEHVSSDLEYDEIANHFFSQREASIICSLSGYMKALTFYSCWVRKEAYVKARGDGLMMTLSQFNVTLAPVEPAALLNNQWAPEDPKHWSLHDLNVGQQYIAALAVEGNPTSIKCMSWRI